MLTQHGSPYTLAGCAGGKVGGEEHCGWNVKWNKINKYIKIRYIIFKEHHGFACIHPLFISYSLLHTHAYSLKKTTEICNIYVSLFFPFLKHHLLICFQGY